MKRSIYNQLKSWKKSPRRKPLLLQGARQVGKTWILKEFGKSEYENLVYINFEETPSLDELFKGSLDIPRILESINAFTNEVILPQKTLLFFDEIQVSPRAITSLKYFCEQAPEIHVVAAGSLLGVSVGLSSSFPVGKVNFMHLYPLSFFEFLDVIGENSLGSLLENKKDFVALPDLLHEKIDELYRKFLFIGGMPEVVKYYLETRNFSGVREIQTEILEAYSRDFSKYSTPMESVKILEIWRSIPAQLAKENKKFNFSVVKKGSRHAQYSSAIEWLLRAGLIYIVSHISTPKIPLSGYVNEKKFKLLLVDTGLLGSMLKLPSKSIVLPNELFKEYNGAFIENSIGCELAMQYGRDLFYWTSNNSAEVDYIIDSESAPVPLEVKSGLHRNIKSLRSYADRYCPDYIYRASPRNFTEDSDFRNIPLYSISWIKNYLEK